MKDFQVYKEVGVYKHIIEVTDNAAQEELVCDKNLSRGLKMNQILTEGKDFIREYFHSDYCFAVKLKNGSN